MTDTRAASRPAVNPERSVTQHKYTPGGEFEVRVMETGYAEAAGLPFPPHIVYIDRDEQGRRRTTFVAEVHENAIGHARALVRAALRADQPREDMGELEGVSCDYAMGAGENPCDLNVGHRGPHHAARTDSLDVERLARALIQLERRDELTVLDGYDYPEMARLIAAEYAALRAAANPEPDR